MRIISYLLLTTTLCLPAKAGENAAQGARSSLSATASGLLLVINGHSFTFDAKAEDWKSAGPANASPRVFEEITSAERFSEKNIFLVNPADGTTDACSRDYPGPCHPPAAIQDFGDCNNRNWTGWTAGAAQYLAKRGPEGVTIFPAAAVGLEQGAVVRDFHCDKDAGIPYFATGNLRKNGFEAGGGGVIAQTSEGWRTIYSERNGLLDNHVISMTEQNGSLWFLTWTGVARKNASGQWTRWSIGGLRTAEATPALSAASGGWQLGTIEKNTALKALSATGSYYCVATPQKYTGWLHAGVLTRNRGSFTPQDVHQSKDLKSASGGRTTADCPNWTRNPDQEPDGDWVQVTTGRAFIPLGDIIPKLEKLPKR